MTILSTGGKILRANGKILKVTDKILYSFNLNSFNIETLNDRGVQWRVGNRSPDFEKRDNRLIIKFSNGAKQSFSLGLDQLDIPNIGTYSVEYTYGGSLPHSSFFGLVYCSIVGGYYRGIWRYSTSGAWSRLDFYYSIPVTCKLIVTRQQGFDHVDIYFNGVFFTSTDTSRSTHITHNVDYNGSSRQGTIELYSLVIEKL